MNEYNITIIGCGAVADLLYMPAIKQLESAKIINLVDLNMSFCDELVKKYSIDNVNCSRTIPKAETDKDIALVLVPTGLHADVVTDCINKGYHVMCEKPLASNISEVNQLIKLSLDKDKLLAVGMARHYMPHNTIIKELIENDTFGDPIKIYFEEGGAFSWPIKTMARFDSKESGNGAALNGTASHLIDLVLWWFGDKIEFNKFHDDSNEGLDINCNIKFTIDRNNKKIPVEGLISMTGNLSNQIIICFPNCYIEVPIFPNQEINLFNASGEKQAFKLNPYNVGIEYGYDSIRRHLTKFFNAISGEKYNSNYVKGDTQIALTNLIDKAYNNKSKINYSWM